MERYCKIAAIRLPCTGKHVQLFDLDGEPALLRGCRRIDLRSVLVRDNDACVCQLHATLHGICLCDQRLLIAIYRRNQHAAATGLGHMKHIFRFCHAILGCDRDCYIKRILFHKLVGVVVRHMVRSICVQIPILGHIITTVDRRRLALLEF